MRRFLTDLWCYFCHTAYYKVTLINDETYSIMCEKCGKEWET